MKKTVNRLRGNAEIEIRGERPESFINECARLGLRFWDFRKTSEVTAKLRMPLADLKKAQRAAENSGCELTRESKRGLPATLGRLKSRWALFAALALCLTLPGVLSVFVWEIEVTGNVAITDAEILSALAKLGVRPGMLGISADSQTLRSLMMEEIGELSWLAVNVTGTKAEVIVRERVPKPEICDRRKSARVEANKGGIVTEVNVLEGAAAVAAGETVEPGDLLITGELESLSSGTRSVHASGEVWARTWYEYSETLPLGYTAKEYTGKTETKRAIRAAGKQINLYLSSGFPNNKCDKIIKIEKISLFDLLELPLELVTERAEYYNDKNEYLSPEDAERELKARLLAGLAEETRGEVVWTEFETSFDGEAMTVSLRAECLEQIGVTILT